LSEKKQQVQDFFSDPKNLKLLQQYAKILIGYMQVVGSFMTFKVSLPVFYFPYYQAAVSSKHVRRVCA
jgi:hypothetical protein